jgi:hypothetical protein
MHKSFLPNSFLLNALLVFFCVPIIFCCCRQKASPKYYWVYFDKRYEQPDTFPIFTINQTNTTDSIKITYLSKADTIQYSFIKTNRDSSSISGYFGATAHLRPFADTAILFDGQNLPITTYIFDEFTADGASLHYYEPSVGVFAIHSATWPGITYLQCSDTIINRKIKRLMKACIPEFYIRGELVKELNR